MKFWSVITVTYNSARRLREYWAAFAADETIEWIVVDNGSSDESVPLARSMGATVIESGINLGFAGANNLGLTHATGQYVLFANPDLRVLTEDLPRLASSIARTGGIVAPRLISPDGTFQFNGRGWPFLLRKMANRLGLTSAGGYLTELQPRALTPVVWVTGAAVAATRAVIDDLRGWDTSFFLYNEDVALGLTARRRGVRVDVDADVTWTHGWERAPASWRWRAMMCEASSTVQFYRRHPVFLLPPMKPLEAFIDRRLALGYEVAGSTVPPAPERRPAAIATART